MSIIGTFPTTIANGQVEDATVVMSLFSWIQAQTNGNACPATTGSAVLKGNGVGGTISATAGIDYVSPTNTGDVTITGLSTVTQSLATPSSAAPGSGVNTFAYRASGGYGGGYALIDAPYNIGMYSVGGTLNIGTGTSGGALTSRVTIDTSGNITTAGNLVAGNIATAGNLVAGAIQFGGAAASGLYNDSVNISIRALTGGNTYFQSSVGSGTVTWATINGGGFQLGSGSFSGDGGGLTGTANSLNAGIGVNQTIHSVGGARGWGTDYYNTSGKTATYYICFQCNSGVEAGGWNVFLNGTQIAAINGSFWANAWRASPQVVTVIVPNGSRVYIAQTGQGAALVYWCEVN